MSWFADSVLDAEDIKDSGRQAPGSWVGRSEQVVKVKQQLSWKEEGEPSGGSVGRGEQWRKGQGE